MTTSSREDDARARFSALYEANYHLILGYAVRRARDADPLDVVAETFTTAWRRLQRVPRGDGARLWLYATARRVLANQERAARRRTRLVGRLKDDAATRTTATFDRTEGPVAAAFACLRSGDRELLGLVAWEGLDAQEIARVLGCSPNAARIRLHRARRRFADELRHEAGCAKHGAPGGHVPVTPIGTEEAG